MTGISRIRAGMVLSVLVMLQPGPGLYAQDDYRPTVMITGSNRGLGFEFARQYAGNGWRVIATARRPESATDLHKLREQFPNVIIERLDVTDEARIVELAREYANEPIDLLINNAGVGGGAADPDITLDAETFHDVLAVNTFAPLRITQAFLPSVLQSRQKKVAVITSRLGSLTLATNYTVGSPFDDSLYYSISKAGVNMGMRRFALQLADRDVSVAILHPGPVATDMLANSGYDLSKAYTPEQSIGGMIRYLDQLGPERSGEFYGHDGIQVPW